MSKSLRVLVTGGAGYIGSHTCKALAKAGHEPITFDNLRTGHRFAVKWGPLIHGDILEPTMLIRAFREYRPDAVIHFAALAYVGESVSHPDIYYRTNLSGTLNLIDAMRMTDTSRLVFSSTCATYGIPKAIPIIESAAQEPVNPYGRSKLMVEQALGDICAAFGTGAIALRYFNAAGADPDGDLGENHDPETHLIPLVLQAAAGLIPEVHIFGTDWPTADGTCIRDYVHVADLAEAHVAAIGNIEFGKCKAYNLGAGRGVSVSEVVNAARRITGRTVKELAAPRRPGDPPVLVADSSTARRALNWTPRLSDLDTMVSTAWAWMSGSSRNGHVRKL